jgi:putative tryptophan/tyrosine transport system substrate-binding protein
MRRREFVIAFGSAAIAWPLAARAQQAEPARRVGILMNRTAESAEGQARVAAIQQRLQQLGWSIGQNLLIEVGWGADDAELERRGAAELVALAPDVILAGGNTFGIAAILRASRTIPIVFAAAVDPVGLGVVASLAHPGGNATGFLAYEFAFGGKLLEILKQIAPGVTRAAILRDSVSPSGTALFAAAQDAAASLGVQVTPVDVRDTGEIERAVGAFARSAGGGLVLMPGGATSLYNNVIVELAARYKLPAVYGYRHMVIGGGLVSYGPDYLDQFRRAAEYVDRILKGEKPADLPVQAPTKYELAVNLKTAKTLGLAVPDSILVRADEVIE